MQSENRRTHAPVVKKTGGGCLGECYIAKQGAWAYLSQPSRSHTLPHRLALDKMAVLSQYDYIFAIGTFFALLDAYNNGASE